MEIAFQHTNPAASHESTLLHVSPRDGPSYSYLIDAGESVSPAAFLGADEFLDGVFLTHAHSDHYASLSQVLAGASDSPLYTSPATAALLEHAFTEADRYQDLGDVTPITDALTPIDGWTPLNDGVYVLPVPAGHTPGAAGFLFRIDDPQNAETVTVLATGDFTVRPAGGYPGLTIPASIDIDVLIANAVTTSDFESALTDAVDVLLERALSGATALVATGALTGVHVAVLLGRLLDDLDRQSSIRLVGQAAKLYAALDYEVPFVAAHPTFEHTDEVLAPGAITIAGPESPTQGSTARLYGVVEDDPDAVFVQLATSSSDAVGGAACATHYVELSNHPTETQFVDTVETHLPRHLVLKHVRSAQAKDLGERFDALFHWGNDDTRAHVLYDDGDWAAPPWVDDDTASRIRRRNYRQSGSRLPIDRAIEDLPTAELERQSPAPAADGVDVATLSRFEATPSEATTDPKSGSTGADPDPAVPSSDTEPDDGSTSPPADNDGVAVDVTDRLAALETKLETVEETHLTAATADTKLGRLAARLDDIEATLDELPAKVHTATGEPVSGTVLRQGDLILIRIDADDGADLDHSLKHQQPVELTIADGPDERSDGQ